MRLSVKMVLIFSLMMIIAMMILSSYAVTITRDGANAFTEARFNNMAENIRQELEAVLPGGEKRQQMLSDYEDVHQRLGESHAPDEAARIMVALLNVVH